MTEKIEQLKTALQESRQYVQDVLAQVGDKWETQVYSDGAGWTIRNLVVHLADAEKGMLHQVVTIAAGNEAIPEGFDIERYNRRITEKHGDKPAGQALEEMAQSRQQLLAWLDTVTPEQLAQKGRHASLQIMSVEEIVQLIADHEIYHAADIEKTLEG